MVLIDKKQALSLMEALNILEGVSKPKFTQCTTVASFKTQLKNYIFKNIHSCVEAELNWQDHWTFCPVCGGNINTKEQSVVHKEPWKIVN